MGLVRLSGGPANGDAVESVYLTWAIAHGHLACTYLSEATLHHAASPAAAPLWPLISGAFAALARIGHHVAFPSQSALGPHCSTAIRAMTRWANRSGAFWSTTRLGYLSWLALLAGVVVLLRASGRGRCWWEPATLVLLAVIPCVMAPLSEDFHPQDLVVMGLTFMGLACAQRRRWAWA
ncbi:MAG TPA: hypothetical protein VND70_09125, partial [Acidimicrobiales bacterium]|nr:hypothetical protein [Acidimicrobiales bacterium]